MIEGYAKFALIACAIGAALALPLSLRLPGLASGETDAWSLPETDDAGAPSVSTIAGLLSATGHFPSSEPPQTVEADAGQEAAVEGPPRLLAIAELDGRIVATFQSENGEIRSARVNEDVGGGWRLVDVSLIAATLEKEEERRVLKAYEANSG